MTMADEAEVTRIARIAIRWITDHPLATRTVDEQATITRHLTALRSAISADIGPLPEAEDDELTALRVILSIVSTVATQLDVIDDQIATIYRAVTVPPSASFIYRFGGRSFSRRVPATMPVSISDSDIGWGVSLDPSSLVDAAGEPAQPGAQVAYSVADPTLVTLVDNGDGSASFDSALAAPGASGIALPASTAINATISNPDGTSFVASDVITVVAGDAVSGGSFVFTPPAAPVPVPEPTPAPEPAPEEPQP